LITGATAGIGRATALKLSGMGYDVIVTGRRAERLEKLTLEIEGKGGSCRTLCFDIQSKDEVDKAMDSLGEQLDNIDLLVNNAGLAATAEPIQSGSWEDWERMIDTNIKGLLAVSKRVIPGMIKRSRGHIVNLSSIAGKEYYETTDNLPVLAYIQGNIGVIQKRQNKLDSARVNLSFAVKFLEEKKDIQALIPYYIHASENEMLAGRMDIALNYAQKAVESAKKEESPIRKRDAYAQLMSVYAAMGEYHLAYDYQNKYLHLRDSIINIETITQMANMRADFEVAQKQNELDRMEASRRLMHIILWLTIISFVVVVFLLAVVYRNGKRRKAMNKELLQKQQALKASKKELEQVNASKEEGELTYAIEFEMCKDINELNDENQKLKDPDLPLLRIP
jgi:NAD(P)-dependent dehydrogenase (short-subunit alcohol dehydrogenase family)